MDLLPWIADERRTAAALIETLTPAQLVTASLCAGWTVHDVGAHLLMPLITPVPSVLVALATSGFDFDRANLKLTAAVSRRHTGPEVADGLRRHAEHRFRPPGMGFEAPLNDLLVHGQDIRRPLGLAADLDPERVLVCLGFTFGTPGTRGARRKVASVFEGLRWEASDLEWTSGAGPVVRGGAEALLITRSGRTAALDELEGAGADLLRSRLTASATGR